MKELEALPRQTKEAQATCEDLQDALTNSQIMLGKLSDLSKERDRLEEELRSTADGLLKKGSELNALFSSLKEVSQVMQSVGGASLH
jgi:flagellar biosynthesis/type III secretory pathway chaperone